TAGTPPTLILYLPDQGQGPGVEMGAAVGAAPVRPGCWSCKPMSIDSCTVRGSLPLAARPQPRQGSPWKAVAFALVAVVGLAGAGLAGWLVFRSGEAPDQAPPPAGKTPYAEVLRHESSFFPDNCQLIVTVQVGPLAASEAYRQFGEAVQAVG